MKMLQRYYDEWAGTWTKQGWLDYMFNTYGNFKIAGTTKSNWKDEPGWFWTRHIPYANMLKLNDKDWNYEVGYTKEEFLKIVNNRSILECEIVLDIDKPEVLPETLMKLKKFTDDFELWMSGGKGHHIHMIVPELALQAPELRKNTRNGIISAFRADIQKNSERVMIALENTPHWRTGRVKTLCQV